MRERIQVTHEVDRTGNLFYLASAFLGALNKIGDALIRYGGGLAKQIDANHKEILKHMSALSDAVQAVADDVTRIGDDVSKVIDLLQQPNPDVEAAITALQAVDEGLDASAEKLEAAIPPPPPVG
jgi:ABC-type transporter Mla subunit MlaD